MVRFLYPYCHLTFRMISTKPPKKELQIKDSPLLSSKYAETIVAIAHRVLEAREIRKAFLRNIIGGRAKTFTDSINFLIKVALVREVVKYPLTKKYRHGMGRKLKYIQWINFESPEIIRSVDNLLRYQTIDLASYPIRNYDKISETGLLILRKYMFRVENKFKKVTAAKTKKVFALLNVEDSCPVNSIRKLYRMKAEAIYGCIKKLLAQGKAEIGFDNKYNRVVLYKNADWLLSHNTWKCENCGYWNPGSNTKYCGKCGDVRGNNSE